MSRWQKTESGWQQTEAPLPEQKPEAAAPVLAVPTAVQLEKPEAAAPTLVVPTAGQLETTNPALGAPLEPPLMPPTEEQAAKRAAQLER